jgi:hypothetical protein
MTFPKEKRNFLSGYFFLEIQSNGSTIPTFYNHNFLAGANYIVSKQDLLNSGLWQKADKGFISNKDEESAKKFTEKYKLS